MDCLGLLRESIEREKKIEDSVWNEFIKIVRVEELEAGEHFIKPDNSFLKIGYIVEGLVNHYVISDSGELVIMDFCYSGEFISIPNPFNEAENSEFWIDAITRCKIISFSVKDLKSLIYKYREIGEVINSIIFPLLELKSRREVDILSTTSAEGYKRFLERFESYKELIPQYQIASYLGITPETLSRIKKRGKS